MSEERYRHELKFVCSEQELRLVENKIKLLCSRDVHTDSEGVYRIKSMYFDTYDDRYLFESISGVDNRHKYRIRVYNDSWKLIRLERKSSVRGLKRKEACEITMQQCRQMLENMPLEDIGEKQNLLKEFAAERTYELLHPCVIVDYVRTPYVYPVGNVRITFDRDIAASESRDFFDRNAAKRAVMPKNFHVIEVKYDTLLPSVLRQLLDCDIATGRTSFSKYVLCRKN